LELRDQEQVERLLREANVLRMRRQLDEAEAKCREALSLSPEDAGVLEMLGDLLRERDQLPEAAVHYRQALERAPARATVEKKYAEVTLELGERQHLRELAQRALDHPELFREPRKKRSVMTALLASLAWPGLGQFYNAGGLDLKGLILAGGALLCSPGLMALTQMALAAMGVSRVAISGSAALGFLFLILWAYSIGDAVSQAARSGRPPSDKLGF
jgi:tetratricopeptide (TPR) repeat protein